MTGYGKVSHQDDKRKINIELRCLNSKQFDFNYRSSGILREKEAEVRTLVSQFLIRGKIDISIFYENLENPVVPPINSEVVVKYHQQLASITKLIGESADESLLPVIMRLPDVLRNERQELKESEWQFIRELLDLVLNDTLSFRNQEGKTLEKDISNRVDMIIKYLEQIPQFEKNRIEKIKLRISERLEELTELKDLDANRFEQEVIYYLEKIDITEEKVRLKNHTGYFITTLKSNEPVGKKLGFISQEMGREINTIGSKANDADIQKIVVQMKDELEKIKEQLLNIL
jgi:uncharacterized protein (TIGR00255 family)